MRMKACPQARTDSGTLGNSGSQSSLTMHCQHDEADLARPSHENRDWRTECIIAEIRIGSDQQGAQPPSILGDAVVLTGGSDKQMTSHAVPLPPSRFLLHPDSSTPPPLALVLAPLASQMT